jgi:hypothetical protein
MSAPCLCRVGEVGADGGEARDTGIGAQATGDLLLELGHADIALSLIVVEGHAQIGDEAQHVLADGHGGGFLNGESEDSSLLEPWLSLYRRASISVIRWRTPQPRREARCCRPAAAVARSPEPLASGLHHDAQA